MFMLVWKTRISIIDWRGEQGMPHRSSIDWKLIYCMNIEITSQLLSWGGAQTFQSIISTILMKTSLIKSVMSPHTPHWIFKRKFDSLPPFAQINLSCALKMPLLHVCTLKKIVIKFRGERFAFGFSTNAGDIFFYRNIFAMRIQLYRTRMSF